MSLLDVQNLRIHFHTRQGVIKAVRDISFSLQRGQTLGIVGESGSGKSVCCQSLLGLLPVPPARIENGSALFDGQDLLQLGQGDLRKIRGARIAMIFQDPMTSLNPYMRIGSQIMEALLIHKNMKKKDARVESIRVMQEVGITDAEQRFDAFPHEFSGGMRQRVMIAMALISDPEILIADEPTTALDVTIQAQILDLLREIQQKRGIAIIFISHDLGVIAGLADQIIVMRKGEIVESGSSDDVFYQTQHAYTKSLLAAVPDNAKPASYRWSGDKSTQPLLQVKNLLTRYGAQTDSLFQKKVPALTAVDGVSLEVRKGEILGLVGESGCGKSTLAKTVMRLVRSDEGEILLRGNDITHMEGKDLLNTRPHFQMIFQDPYASLNPRMNVYDTLAEPLLLNNKVNRSQLREQILQLLEDVGLEAADANKYPHEFSGGQRQRIAIARALALQPELLIADEPVSALDVTIQAQILSLLLELVKKYSISMIFISHDLSVVRYMSDSIAVMYRGKIIEYGDTETVFASPTHLYTQSLLSAIPVADPEKERKRRRIDFDSPPVSSM